MAFSEPSNVGISPFSVALMKFESAMFDDDFDVDDFREVVVFGLCWFLEGVCIRFVDVLLVVIGENDLM